MHLPATIWVWCADQILLYSLLFVDCSCSNFFFFWAFCVKCIMIGKFCAVESDKKREAYPWEERMSKPNKCQAIDLSDHAKPLKNMKSLSGDRILSILLYWPLSVSIMLWTFATWIALGAVFQFLQILQMFLRCYWVNLSLLKKFLFLSASLVRTFHRFSILDGHTPSFKYISLVLYILLSCELLQIFTYEKMTNECAVLLKLLKPALTI